jgi:hypothetical protein
MIQKPQTNSKQIEEDGIYEDDRAPGIYNLKSKKKKTIKLVKRFGCPVGERGADGGRFYNEDVFRNALNNFNEELKKGNVYGSLQHPD